MTDQKELIVISSEPKQLEKLFQNDGLSKVIEELETKVKEFVPDVSTEKGRKEVASFAHKIARTKTALDKAGKNLTEDWRKQTKLVNADRNKIKEELERLQTVARQPLTDFENREKKRIEKHQLNCDHIKNYEDSDLFDTSLDECIKLLDELNLIVVDESYEEFEMTAGRSLGVAKSKFRRAIEEKKELQEARQLKEKLEREEEERKQKERDEKIANDARIEAERLAQEEADKKESDRIAEIARIEKEKQDAIEKIEKDKKELEAKNKQDKIDAEKKAIKDREDAIAAERKKIEDEKAEEKRLYDIEQKKKNDEQVRLNKIEADRKADLEHRRIVNNAIVDGLVTQARLTTDNAVEIVTLMAQGKIKNVQINY